MTQRVSCEAQRLSLISRAVSCERQLRKVITARVSTDRRSVAGKALRLARRLAAAGAPLAERRSV